MTVASAQKSTTVRSHVRPPRGLRTAFSLAERVAPALVARAAFFLWCRPTGTRRTTTIPGGTRWTLPLGRGHVVGQTWGSGPRVYLVHGWGGHRGQLAAFVEPLVAAGHEVVAFDALSHGESGPGAFGPRQATMPEMAATLAAVVAARGHAHAIVTHSFGGSTTTLALLDGLTADRVVLVAPMADPLPYTRDFAEVLGFGESTRQRFLALMERRAGRPLTDFDVARGVEQLDGPLPAALVVHDTQDKEAHHADGERLARSWPGARLVTTTGLGHRRILRDPDVVAEVVKHVTAA
ncbi:hypothetical protein CTKZ_05790 [Cellulomonas algicola]|uniref:AB hydrolase-1 domain-containing protein n=1 Tax=Cellulomonas algicola TaxID=2071633 RepID=A0A401UWE8_9CELL|nr:alpha/beta hydrolase [Cellulomonas algicola]GCD19017.1 hypothetical protein CTKZ_05790 [Cellulomonas algicola]